ncbi:endoglucanase E-4-like [Saccoglossus kowalevskii]|uniref:Endoglucanase n=1 Tax=Saccoglossus kowalevskii TaxID=10224 RepID=A0ABM0MJ79_SACKO|nr:PREDICTED: endoglucanase-like [Saccoglossus kowalevskii]
MPTLRLTEDTVYAAQCKEKAEALYEYAMANFGSANKDSGIYKNPVFKDELVWAMIWLYKATRIESYLTTAVSKYKKYSIGELRYTSFSWKNKNPGVAILLYEETSTSGYTKDANKFMNNWLIDIERTPLGLAYALDWGPLRAAAGSAFIGLKLGDLGVKRGPFREFAMQQIHYILGDTGRSYVVGFGNNPPQNIHHRDSSCPKTGTCNSANALYNPKANPIILTGALTGGPDNQDYYADDRTIIEKSEVALDYNAAFQSAVAALKHLELNGNLPTDY